jgi:transaldolase
MPGILDQLNGLGQSAWLDSISRTMFQDGSLADKISQGLRGMTSNPTIFDQAIASTELYDQEISELNDQGLDSFAIYDKLTVSDIQRAAELFLPLYQSTAGADGYVSLEIDPRLSAESEKTIAEGKRLWAAVDRPNLMLKIPATPAGSVAIEELVAAGFNVNVTLIFSSQQYADSAGAYIRGLGRLSESGGELKGVHSVASVFVSRLDAAVDKLLPGDSALRGTAAVANARQIYQEFRSIFGTADVAPLLEAGANLQRPLWASTGVKDPAYADTKYVEELILSDTVNTLPVKTLSSLLALEQVKATDSALVGEAQGALKAISAAGVDLNALNSELLAKGLTSFVDSFSSLIKRIEDKAAALGVEGG